MSKRLSKKINNLSRQAMIAAIYAVLSLCLSAISYGPVNIRISEALVLLPLFSFHNISGVTVGCFITNLIGFFTGANILGSLDIIFGTFATFAAAICTYLFRKVRIKGLPILSVVPPIIFNAVIIGWELCVFINNGSFSPVIFWAQATSVGAGQFLSCGVIGLMMVRLVENNKTLKDLVS
ncbi:MAG: QueT transporter family protein [Ruminococcaceae bacterium]|nr:QueT transporter family protein [Oscillospiraceae bacterium]